MEANKSIRPQCQEKALGVSNVANKECDTIRYFHTKDSSENSYPGFLLVDHASLQCVNMP